jgi:hypothetical protein
MTLSEVAQRSRQRRHPRFALGTPIEIRVSGTPSWATVVPRDVSESGMSFLSERPLDVGQPVRVCARARTGSSCIISGVVRRVVPFGDLYIIGVERGGP